MSQDLYDVEFWRKLNPELHASDVGYFNDTQIANIDAASLANMRQAVITEGYLQIAPVDLGVPLPAMANCIMKMRDIGLSPPFAFVYDEFWAIYHRLHQVIEGVLGGEYKVLPDFWAWHVDPQRGESGWKPHRDKGHEALFPDGSPKSLTIWLPLTDATTLNGCMYIVPADHDPTYNTPEDKQWKFAHADVRALPAAAGSVLCWNQAVLHWGSRSSKRAAGPRVSVALEFQRADVPPFNQPLIPPVAHLTHEDRMWLIFKQILQYRHMYPLSPELQALAEAGIAARALPQASAQV